MAGIGNARAWAAASSTASGSPSASRQIFAMMARSRTPVMRPGWTSRARSTNSAAASGGNQATERNELLCRRTRRDAAGREDVQLRASRQEIVEEGGDPGPDVLAVVQDEQPDAVPQALRRQPLGSGAGRVVAHPAAGEDRERQRRLGAHGRQLDEPERRVRCGPGRLNRQPRLAAPTRAHERDEPMPGDRGRDRRELVDPTDERGQWRRQHEVSLLSASRPLAPAEALVWNGRANCGDCGDCPSPSLPPRVVGGRQLVGLELVCDTTALEVLIRGILMLSAGPAP